MVALAEASPFALPARIDPGLETLRRYWSALKRAQNAMPFADDLNLGQLRQFAASLLVIDVREMPQRFRFDVVGPDVERHYGELLADRFIDEIPAHPPLEYLASQCDAMMQSQSPAWFAQPGGAQHYERLLLPMWGNGYISRILGAYAWRAGQARHA